MPSGHGRALGGFGDRRLDVEIAAQRLDRGLEAELRLRLLDVEPVRLLADDCRAAAPRRRAPGGDRRAGCRATAPPRSGGGAARRDERARPRSPRGGRRRARSAGSTASSDCSIDTRRDSASLRAPASASRRCSVSTMRRSSNCWRSCRPALRTSRSRRREASTAVLASSSSRTRPRVAAASASACSSAVERREHRVELGDPLALGGDVIGQRDRGPIEALELGLDLPAFALHPGECLGGGGEAGVVGVETCAELGLRGTGGGELVVGVANSLRRRRRAGRRRAADSSRGPVERSRRGAAGRRADAPASGTEAVADVGDDDRVGVGDRRIDRGAGLGDPDRVADQRVEQRRQPRPVGVDVRSHGLADAAASPRLVSARRRRARHRSCRSRVNALERTPRRVGSVDDDRGERLAERRLDRRLPPGIDLDQIEQRAEDAVDVGETFGAGAGTCARRAPAAVPRHVPTSSTRPPPPAGAPESPTRVAPRRCDGGLRPARPRRPGASRRPPRQRSRHATARSRHRVRQRARATRRRARHSGAARSRCARRQCESTAVRHAPRPPHWPP